MPNHVHLIILLKNGQDQQETGGRGNPPLQNVVGQIKSFTTMKWNKIFDTQMQTLWQRGYHDHIIRGEKECYLIYQYIDENPIKWVMDKYYFGNE